MQEITKRYRKKPEIIDAVRVTETNLERVAQWCGGRVFGEPKASDPQDVYSGVYMPTLEGPVAVGTDAYIFRRPEDGRFDVMSVHEFEKNYEQVGVRGDVVPPITPPKVPYAHWDEH